ncbi:DUF58 domain-containing protein [Vibrio algicola]|uniref:DUF58 domain-containing protein n=1 Tax=Vibrio algicola TaxID=2662262 RepID=A0A5Q0THP3_9VIBR|nr:DUF58 domain-containing protein [Vibrio algicola]
MSAPMLPPFSTGVRLSLKELLNYKSHTVYWQPPAKSIWSQLNGGHASQHKGRGMNFSEVRQYQAGDDIRSIDWRVTARTGKAHTKLFTEEREQPVMLYIDLSRTMRFGSQLLFKSVQCAHLASLLSWLTVENKDRIGALIDTGDRLIELKPTARQQGALHISHQLVELNNQLIERDTARLTTKSTDDITLPFQRVLQTMHRMCPKGSDIIFISDFQRLSEQDKPLLNQLTQHNRLRFVHIFDPLEMGDTPFRGSEYVTDGQQTQWLNFGLKRTRQQLENRYTEHFNLIENMCKKMAIPMQSLSSADSLLSQLGATRLQTESSQGNHS